MMPSKQDQYWKTAEQVTEGLRRFYRYFGEAPSSSVKIEQMGRDIHVGRHRAFPGKSAIFKFFKTMYEAWASTGIEDTLPKCKCGNVLHAYNSRGCAECNSRKQSDGLRKRWAERVKYQFTPEMDEELKRTYQEEKRSSKVARIRALADRLGMPRWVMSRRARQLGITRVKEGPWSAEEVAVLEKYSYMNEERIRMKLKDAGFTRSVTGIHIQFTRRKLRKEAPYYTANRLSILIGEDSHVVLRWIDEGMLPFTEKGTERHGGQNGDIRLIHETDVYIFLVNQRQLYDLRKVNQTWFLEMLFDYPAENLSAIAERMIESGIGKYEKPIQYDGSRWRERKGFKRPDRKRAA